MKFSFGAFCGKYESHGAALPLNIKPSKPQRRYGGIMKRILSLFLALVIFVGCMTVLASCKAPEDAGAEISVYLGEEVYDFDPTDYYVNSNAEQLMSLLYEPLFKINEEGELEKAAASKYKVDKEERTIVIELRESYWSDDFQVKAQDYIYAWVKRILDPNRANPAAALFYDIENAIAVKSGVKSVEEFGAVASGPFEITITYREGADYNQLLKNLASVATSPAREDVIHPSEAHWSKSPSSIVTNGPFKVEELDLELGNFTLSRNLGYHQKTSTVAYADKVNPAKLISFLNGYGSEIALSYEDIEDKTVFYMIEAPLDMRSENKDKATVVDDLSTYTYVLNTEKELFKIPEVRRALSMALDRTSMLNAISFGKVANSFVSAPLANKLYNGMVRPLSAEQNMAEAKSLIESASAKLQGIDMAFTLSINNDEKSIAIAELAKAAWSELGFNVTVNVLKLTKTTVTSEDQTLEITDSTVQYLVKNASMGKREFDILALDWQMYSTDPFVALAAFTSSMNGCGVNFTTNSARTNISGWRNASYDAYVNEAYMADSEEERNEALRNAEKILLEELPVIPLIHNQNFSFQSADISEVSVDGFGNFVFTEMAQLDYQLYIEKEEIPEDEEEEDEEEDEDESEDEEDEEDEEEEN